MAATERDGFMPKSKDILLDELKGSLKALRVEGGDLIIFRVLDPTQDLVDEASVKLNAALAHIKADATALVMDARLDLERLPYDLAVKILKRVIAKHKLKTAKAEPVPEDDDEDALDRHDERRVRASDRTRRASARR